MITWNESEILLAVIGTVGLLSSFAVLSRSFSANNKYEQRLRKVAVCEVCDVQPCDCK